MINYKVQNINQTVRMSDIVKKLVDEFIQEYNRKGKYPSQTEIVTAIIESNDPLKDPALSKRSYVQPLVCRSIPHLIKSNKIIETHNKRYISCNKDIKRIQAKVKIEEEIRFEREDIFIVSRITNVQDLKNNGVSLVNATVAIAVCYESIYHAIGLFKEYLGEENCYGVYENNGLLFLLIFGRSVNEVRDLIKDIRIMVNNSYCFFKDRKKLNKRNIEMSQETNVFNEEFNQDSLENTKKDAQD